jgi:glyoxylase-like metal-dependent hydrolase (beta-lactamase superfamily II)
LNPVPVHAFNPGPMTGDGNWTWLLPGRVPTLIDAGTGDPRHLDAVAAALGGRTLAQVLVTHGHVDHASGAPALAARTPATRFRKMPWPGRDEQWPVGWQPIADGATIETGDSALVALHTPGHAPDHLCFWHGETRTAFTGDLVQRTGTVFIPGNEHGDVAAYIASLERLLALDPVRLYPAHGPIVEEPVRLLRAYVQHRREREEQVLDALRRGDTTAAEMTARIYRGVQGPLLPLARESVTAHLRKLEREGRVRRNGDLWNMLVDRSD